MPDMIEVLKRFGFSDEDQKTRRRTLTPIPEEEVVDPAEEVEKVIGLEKREPVRLKQSRTLMEEKKDGNGCIRCKGYA